MRDVFRNVLRNGSTHRKIDNTAYYEGLFQEVRQHFRPAAVTFIRFGVLVRTSEIYSIVARHSAWRVERRATSNGEGAVSKTHEPPSHATR